MKTALWKTFSHISSQFLFFPHFLRNTLDLPFFFFCLLIFGMEIALTFSWTYSVKWSQSPGWPFERTIVSNCLCFQSICFAILLLNLSSNFSCYLMLLHHKRLQISLVFCLIILTLLCQVTWNGWFSFKNEVESKESL